MSSQDSGSVAVLGKFAPSEYTPDEVVRWIGIFNNIRNAHHLGLIRESVYKAIDAGELTLRGNPYYPMAGICPCCRKKHLRQQTIPKKDLEGWCRKLGLSFGADDSERLPEVQAEEKEVGKVTRKAFLSIVAAKYEVIGYFMRGEAEKLPPYSHLVRSGDITPDGLGKYLTNEFQACSSANERIAEALKQKR